MKKKVSILFCGYAKGKKSAQLECYYAGKGNKFWDVLYEVGLTPVKITAEEYNRLTDFGMEVTDIVKDQCGNDCEIEPTVADIQRLRGEIGEKRPRLLAFNGKKAAKTFLYRKEVEYGSQKEKINETLIYVLPSTSAQARRYWDISYWKELARLSRDRI